MSVHYYRTALVLGILTAVGPFAIDMYLPALPSIGSDLNATTGAVQMSLLIFFLSMGASQIIIGPLADIMGRKPPIYWGLVIFAVGSVGAALAPTVEVLIAFRFLQGIGASAGMVISRAVVRDLHTGTEAARLMSLLMLVFSVSPILAPLTGSIIIELAGWRAVFWTVTVIAVLGDRAPGIDAAGNATGGASHRQLAGKRDAWLWLSSEAEALHGTDRDWRLRHLKLLRLSVQLVIRADRALRADAHALQRLFLDQCGCILHHVAADGLHDRTLWASACGARGGQRFCGGHGYALRDHVEWLPAAVVHGGHAVCRIWLSRTRHSDDFGSGHG